MSNFVIFIFLCFLFLSIGGFYVWLDLKFFSAERDIEILENRLISVEERLNKVFGRVIDLETGEIKTKPRRPEIKAKRFIRAK